MLWVLGMAALVPTSSWAVRGKILPEKENPDFSCALQEGSPKDKITLCSATLIRSDMLLTAAHCVKSFRTFEGIQDLVASCGNGKTTRMIWPMRGGKPGISDSRMRMHPKWQIRSDRLGLNSNDIAVIRVEPFPAELVPARLPNAPSEANRLLQPRKDTCRLSGWGINNSGILGTLNSALAPIKDLTGARWIDFSENPSERKIGQMWSMDSGGTYYCREKATDPWVVSGIAVGRVLREAFMENPQPSDVLYNRAVSLKEEIVREWISSQMDELSRLPSLPDVQHQTKDADSIALGSE